MNPDFLTMARLALRELRGSREFTVFFVINLSLGLCGLLALDALRHSVNDHFQSRARAVLGGDLQVEVDNRNLTATDLADIQKVLPAGTKVQAEKRFLTMAAGSNHSRLVDVQAVDEAFPLFPSLVLKEKGRVEPGSKLNIITSRSIWISAELAVQLNVKIGDDIHIAGQPFRVDDFVTEDAAMGSLGLSTAPKVYLGIPQIDDLPLFEKGSRYEDARLYKLPPGSQSPDSLALAIENTASARDLDVDAFTDSSGRAGRFWQVLGDYLTLIALITLFLAGVGSSYLFRGYLERRLGEIAILKVLGANIGTVRGIYVIQLVLLALCSSAIAIVVSLLIVPVLPRMLGPLLPGDVTIIIPLASIAKTVLIATATSVLVALPLLARLGYVKPTVLIQESGGFGRITLTFRDMAAYVPAIFFYWALAVWQGGSPKIGSTFIAAFAVSLGAILITGSAGWHAIKKLQVSENVSLRLAALNLLRHHLATITCFLAIGAGVLLAGIIPQIRSVLHQELTRSGPSTYPSLFMIDIQPDQVDDVDADLKVYGSTFQDLAPVVRARLKLVNNVPIETIIDEGPGEGRQKYRRARRLARSYSITYGSDIKSSERITQGHPFEASPTQPQISLEEEFAERARLKLGDMITFDISGIEVTGEVVNFRQVRWASLQPNFRIMVSPGVLEDAPATYVATVPQLPEAARADLQIKFATMFANISIIDVTQIFTRILKVVESITIAMFFMAALTLTSALAVLISITRFNADARRPQMALLKVLGARFEDVRTATLWEFSLLGFIAAAGGSLLSVGVSYTMCYILFDRVWSWTWQWPVMLIVLTPVICATVGFMAAHRALKTRPVHLLSY